MRYRRTTRALLAGAVSAALVVGVGGCDWFKDASLPIRSEMPMVGMVAGMKYTINSTPDGGGETNKIEYRGVNGNSPHPLVSTVFDRGAGSRTQTATVTAPNGAKVDVLSMNKLDSKIGLTSYLEAQIATYVQNDVVGNQVCGAKVRVQFMPNLAQVLANDKARRGWDAIFYYSIPCATAVAPPSDPNAPPLKVVVPPDPAAAFEIDRAKFLALTINQQWTPRLTGKPLLFNRGHSVTVVGGKAGNLVGGWWNTPLGIENSGKLVTEMANDLNKHEWLSFSDPSFGGLVYSAGDADVYASLRRVFLNRQSDYMVHFRASPDKPWRRVKVEVEYNKEWNDWKSNWEALTGGDAPKIDDLIDSKTGLPKEDLEDADKAVLKEIERSGCQNCPNPELEQIKFVDVDNGNKILYAMTIRAYLGANRTMVMFGQVPSRSRDDALKQAEDYRQRNHMTNCPVFYDAEGKKKGDDEQYSQEECAGWLKEGALWNMLTTNPTGYGLDVVGQFQVVDNSSYASSCKGSGEYTSCEPVVTNRRLDSSYLFSDAGDNLNKAWTILQLLGEVGMRTLGLSYASSPNDGSGLNFAMVQPQVRKMYYSNMNDPAKLHNPEKLFMLDARALQLPQTLGEAEALLYGTPN